MAHITACVTLDEFCYFSRCLAGLAEALNLASALDILPPRITITGIQPESIAWEQALSAPVNACIPEIINTIQAILY